MLERLWTPWGFGRIARLVAGTAAGLVTAATAAAQGGRCGEERWPVKVLEDRDAAEVDLAPTPSTVAALLGVPRPDESRPHDRRLPLERRTFRVHARLVEIRDGQADGDIHLVLADLADPARTLVAEIPDSACAPRSRHASDFAEAQRVVRALATPIDVEVEGVAYWDDHHGQVGFAPNGIELHPVLRLVPLSTRHDLLREELAADPPDTTGVRVWLNRASRVYHCPGSSYYGRTARGEYLPEPVAIARGARPAGGRRCLPAGAPVRPPGEAPARPPTPAGTAPDESGGIAVAAPASPSERRARIPGSGPHAGEGPRPSAHPPRAAPKSVYIS